MRRVRGKKARHITFDSVPSLDLHQYVEVSGQFEADDVSGKTVTICFYRPYDRDGYAWESYEFSDLNGNPLLTRETDDEFVYAVGGGVFSEELWGDIRGALATEVVNLEDSATNSAVTAWSNWWNDRLTPREDD